MDIRLTNLLMLCDAVMSISQRNRVESMPKEKASSEERKASV